MARQIQGNLDGRGLTIGIAMSRFSGDPCQRLLDGAIQKLEELGTSTDQIDVVYVPGAFEIPIIAQEMSLGRPQRYDAVITLGCVIRGETPHFDFVAGPCADALMKLQTGGSVLDKNPPTPVIFGVLTTDTREQAMARSGGEKENKGADCAEAAVEMANLLKKMRGF
ncbi:MAG: 6,7-dimethyl-8-ribityllumazine synthase [Planctomycetia bacterium]|jgi:6,7-dimethyl-8-ribityllumazine synthase|nr:6,7-dimethyl-8-ribityllumazine synthase [Planctomycetia bacterium]NCG57016.1 6,7-dimethyl-8-ribityllumazine synthase [Pseudomonadota bacterium]